MYTIQTHDRDGEPVTLEGDDLEALMARARFVETHTAAIAARVDAFRAANAKRATKAWALLS